MNSGRRPVIGVMGGGEAPEATIEAARRLGRLVAEAGWVLLTGGRPAGVMEAASAGAKSVPGSLTIGVLPGAHGGSVSPRVDVAIFTGIGEARNAINVLSSDVVVACGVDGAGTASEVALALKLARPTILLAPSPEAAAFFRAIGDPGLLQEADTPEGAIGLIERRLGIERRPGSGPKAGSGGSDATPRSRTPKDDHIGEERMAAEYRSFREFYPAYLAEHKERSTRRLHFVGTLLVILVLVVAAVTRDARWLLAAPVVGYGFAWVGHFAFERNRPATFRHPLYSLAGDFVMFKDILTGRLPW